MKKYFVHLLKKNLLPLACLALFCIVMYVIPLSVESYGNWNSLKPTDDNFQYRYVSLYYGNILTALGLISVFIPIYLFSYKMNKRSTDMHYALPITKTKILTANFLVGLIFLYSSYTLSYWLGFLVVVIRVRRIFLIYYLYIYLASLIPAFILYAVTAFVYTRANTIIDGIISVFLTFFLLSAAGGALDQFLFYVRSYTYSVHADAFLPFTPLIQIGNSFGNALVFDNVKLWFDSDGIYAKSYDACTLVGCIIWALLAVGATIGLFLTEKKSKAENCGQVSESIFCYKILLPVYTFLLGAICRDSIVTLCAVAFGSFIASVVYKRTIKIGWKLAAILGGCFIGGIIFSIIPEMICAGGLF